MTWARIKATGSGRLAARLVVEGLGYEFVTDASMRRSTTGGRLRINGLLRDGLTISNSVDIPHAEIQASGLSVKISDIGGLVTAAFTTRATARTYLSQNLTVLPTTVNVDSTDGFAATGYIHIGTECMSYSAKTATTFTVVRAQRDTTAQSQYTSDGANTIRQEVTDQPVTVEGHRVKLFVYGDGDDPQGDGTQVFLGIVSRDAHLDDGVTWSLAVDPITRALDGDLGGDLKDPPGIRGAYYSWAGALYISMTQLLTASSNGTYDPNATALEPLVGFFESQEDFVAALNAKLLAIQTVGGTTWTTQLRAVSDGPAGWHIEMRTDAASPKWVNFQISSPVDYCLRSNPSCFFSPNGTPTPTSTLSAGTTYVVMPDLGVATQDARAGDVYGTGPSRIPRAYVYTGEQAQPPGTLSQSRLPADNIAWPSNRVYLDTVGVDSLQYLRVASNGGTDGAVISWLLDPFKASNTDRYVWVDRMVSAEYGHTAATVIGTNYQMSPERVYSTSSLYAFLANVTSQAPNFANTGQVPPVYGVFNASFSSTIQSQLQGRPYASERRYISVKKTKFADYLSAELRLLGLFPYVDTSGTISFRPIKLNAITEATAKTIDATNEITSDSWSGWERGAAGVFNALRILNGYDAFKDAFGGSPIYVRDLSAFSRNRTPNVIEIACKSECDTSPTIEDANALAGSVLGIFGRPYVYATINVPYTFFDLVPGDTVTVTSAVLPNGLGARGLTGAQGIVIGKRFDLDRPTGTLSLLLHEQNIAGYSPALFTSAFSVVTGNTFIGSWGAAGYPFESSVALFPAGTRIRLVRYDSEVTTSNINGVVVSTFGGTITVTTDGAWTPGAFSYALEYISSDDAGISAAQKLYAYIADSNAVIVGSSTNSPARTFSP